MQSHNEDKIRITIHPLFFAFAIVLVAIGEYVVFVNYMAALFLHEYAHAFVAKHRGYSINNIKVLPFGIALNLRDGDMHPKDEVAIAMAGPLANLVTVCICMALWWIFPQLYQVLNIFVFANAVTLVFNLLPILPLDGGRVVIGLLSQVWERKKICKLCFVFNIVVGIVLLSMFVYGMILHIYNLTYIFMSIFVIIAGIPSSSMRDCRYLRAYSYPKSNNVCRTKIIAIDAEQPLYKLYRHMSSNYYLIANVVNNKGQIIATLDECEIVKALEKNIQTKKLSECFSI